MLLNRSRGTTNCNNLQKYLSYTAKGESSIVYKISLGFGSVSDQNTPKGKLCYNDQAPYKK